MSAEVQTLVVYDIEKDAVRNKISEACKDFGLERIQFSAFLGRLDRTMRKELFARLEGILGKSAGRILLIPICQADYESRMLKEAAGDVVDGDGS